MVALRFTKLGQRASLVSASADQERTCGGMSNPERLCADLLVLQFMQGNPHDQAAPPSVPRHPGGEWGLYQSPRRFFGAVCAPDDKLSG